MFIFLILNLSSFCVEGKKMGVERKFEILNLEENERKERF